MTYYDEQEMERPSRQEIYERDLMLRGLLLLEDLKERGEKGLPDFFANGFTTLDVLVFSVVYRNFLSVLRSRVKRNEEALVTVNERIRQMERLYKEHSSRARISAIDKFDSFVAACGNETEYTKSLRESDASPRDMIDRLLSAANIG